MINPLLQPDTLEKEPKGSSTTLRLFLYFGLLIGGIMVWSSTVDIKIYDKTMFFLGKRCSYNRFIASELPVP